MTDYENRYFGKFDRIRESFFVVFNIKTMEMIGVMKKSTGNQQNGQRVTPYWIFWQLLRFMSFYVILCRYKVGFKGKVVGNCVYNV